MHNWITTKTEPRFHHYLAFIILRYLKISHLTKEFKTLFQSELIFCLIHISVQKWFSYIFSKKMTLEKNTSENLEWFLSILFLKKNVSKFLEGASITSPFQKKKKKKNNEEGRKLNKICLSESVFDGFYDIESTLLKIEKNGLELLWRLALFLLLRANSSN